MVPDCQYLADITGIPNQLVPRLASKGIGWYRSTGCKMKITNCFKGPKFPRVVKHLSLAEGKYGAIRKWEFLPFLCPMFRQIGGQSSHYIVCCTPFPHRTTRLKNAPTDLPEYWISIKLWIRDPTMVWTRSDRTTSKAMLFHDHPSTVSRRAAT
jgi:hypothetical protein